MTATAVRQFRRDRGNPHGLASDYVWSMAEDAQGDLWLATDGGGVARWERRTETFQQFRHDPQQPQSLASDTVRALLIDSKGLIWAGTKDHGLDILDPRTGIARHYRHRESDAYSLPSDAIGALYADHEGRVWVGSDGGLSRYDSDGRRIRYLWRGDERRQRFTTRAFAPSARITTGRCGSAQSMTVSPGSIRTAAGSPRFAMTRAIRIH